MTLLLEPFLAAFAATAVEFFETLVIAYAVVRAGYPREAISAVIVGHLLVAAAAAGLFPFHELLPITWLRLIAALLLTMTGGYWTLKSLRRLRAGVRPRWVEDPLGKLAVIDSTVSVAAFSLPVFLVMTKSAIVEAAEIAVFVLPVAVARNAWLPAISGCLAAIVVVMALMLLLHQQLRRIPEVRLKLGAGLLLMGMGIVWLAELALHSA